MRVLLVFPLVVLLGSGVFFGLTEYRIDQTGRKGFETAQTRHREHQTATNVQRLLDDLAVLEKSNPFPAASGELDANTSLGDKTHIRWPGDTSPIDASSMQFPLDVTQALSNWQNELGSPNSELTKLAELDLSWLADLGRFSKWTFPEDEELPLFFRKRGYYSVAVLSWRLGRRWGVFKYLGSNSGAIYRQMSVEWKEADVGKRLWLGPPGNKTANGSDTFCHSSACHLRSS